MSKSVARLKSMKKVTEKINHSSRLRTNIPAGMASAAPPLGTQLGQRNINIAAFCKDFNERTAEIKPGVPLPTRVKLNPDRTHEIEIHQPPTSFLLKQAAGILKAAMQPGKEISGKITLKHVYEIANIKFQDPPMRHRSMQEICFMVIGTARTLGIEVVRDLTAEDYATFLEERKVYVAEQRKLLDEIREAKMLRTA